MDVEVNWWAIVLAAAAGMAVGAIWYAKPVFGTTWQKLVGKSDKDLKEMSWMPMVMAMLGSLVTAWVLAHMIFLSNYFYGPQQDYSWLSSALMTAFFAWLGFQVTMIAIHDGFEGRRKKLSALTAANQLATLLAMGLVLGLMKP